MTDQPTAKHPTRIYVLVDVSASMYGATLQAAQDAFESLVKTVYQVLAPDFALQCTVIMYESSPAVTRLETPQTVHMISQIWQAAGASNLGKALHWVASDAGKLGGAGLCFTLTDGQATDNVEAAAARLPRDRLLMVLIGCGRDADLLALEGLTDHAFRWHEWDTDSFAWFLTHTCSRFIRDNGRTNGHGN